MNEPKVPVCTCVCTFDYIWLLYICRYCHMKKKEQGEETQKEQDFKIDQGRSCRALGDVHSVTTFSNRGLTVTIFLIPAQWLSSGHQSQPLLTGKIPSWTLGAKVVRFSKARMLFQILMTFSTKKHQHMTEKRVTCSLSNTFATLDSTWLLTWTPLQPQYPRPAKFSWSVKLRVWGARLRCLYSADKTVFTNSEN